MTRRRQIAIGAAALVIAGMGAARGPILRFIRSSPERRAREEKVNSSIRILTYPVEAERPVLLALLPEDTELKLLTNLEVEEQAIAAPAGLAPGPALPQGGALAGPEFVYALEVTYLDAAGRVLQSAEYWEKTTKTRVRDPGALVDREEAFFPAGETTPCDTRATYLLVRDMVRRGAATLRISLVRGSFEEQAAGARRRRILLRCMRSRELTRDEAALRWSKMREDERDRALREVNLYKADLVSEAERIELMRRQWQVVPALPQHGEEHPTVPVYYTNFFETYEAPRDELARASLAGPLRALALNLVGPLNLWVEVARAGEAAAPLPIGEDTAARPPGPGVGASSAGGDPPAIDLVGLREDGVFFSRRERLEPAAGGEPRTPIHVPLGPGPVTVYCRPVNFRAFVRFYVDRTNALEGTEVTRVVSPVGERERYLEVRPEVHSTSYYDARPGPGPGGAPLEVEAEVVHERLKSGGGEQGDEDVAEVRIAARVPVDPTEAAEELRGGGRAGGRPFALEVDMLAADGALVERRAMTGIAEASFHDAYWREFEERRLVSEPYYFTLRCPAAVRRLRVRAAERVDIAFYSRIRGGEDVTYVPEDYPETPEIRVSQVFAGRLKTRTWFYYRPINQFDLAGAGREVRVQVQRRLFEERERAREAYDISNFARALEPLAPAGRFRVLEPGRTAAGRLLIGRPGAWFLVRPGGTERVAVTDPIDPADPRPLPLTVRYEAAEPAGPTATAWLVLVYVDGRRALEGTLTPGGGGLLDLGAYPQGERALRVEVYARGPSDPAYHLDPRPPFRFFVDQPVVEGSPALPRLEALHFEREAFPLVAEAPLEVEIDKTGVEPVVLNCVLFAPQVDTALAAARSGSPPAAPGQPAQPPRGTRTGAGVRDEVIVDVSRVERGAAGPPRLRRIETRRLSVRRPEDGLAYAEDAAGRTTVVGRGERFFVAARAEFEPGTYRFSFRRDPALASWPALAAERLLFRIAVVDPGRAEIGRARFARLNLKGPLALRVVLDPADVARAAASEVRLLAKIVPARLPGPIGPATPATPATPTAAPLEERIVSRDPATGRCETTVEVGPGLSTVVIGTLAAPLGARFFIDRPVDALAGLYAISVPEDVRERAWLEVLPDETEDAAHLVAPGDRPLVYPLAPDGAPPPALIRVETSIPLAAPSEVEPVAYAFTVAFLDAGGRALASTSVTATALFARASFDRAGGGAVSEPFEVLFAPPEGAAAIAISAGGLAIYATLSRSVPGDAVQAYTPLDYARPPGIRVLDLAHRDRRFLPLDPSGAADLVAAGRARRLVRARSRVREVEEPPAATGFAEPALPVLPDGGAVSRSKLLEPLPKGSILDPAGWGEALFAQVRANDRVRFVVKDAGAPDTPTVTAAWATADVPVYFDFAGAPLAEIAALVDGKRLTAFLPVEAHGRFIVPAVPLGPHEVSFATSSGATFYVGAAPAEPKEFRPLRERVVSRLATDGALVLDVEKRDGRDIVLNGALYVRDAPPGPAASETGAPAIEVTIEGLEAARRRATPFPEPSRETHWFHLCPTETTVVLDLDRFAVEPSYVYPFFVPLKSDLPDGRYRATVRLRGPKEGAVRFIVLRADAPVLERAKPAALRRD
jgi:hypothetical protein